MSEKTRESLVKYGITVAVGLLLGYLTYAARINELGAFTGLAKMDQYRVMCDVFTVPGMMLILSGCLMFVSNEGALDGVKFLGHLIGHTLIPGMGTKIKNYSDYVQSKREKKTKGYGFLFVVGALFLLVALVFLAMFTL